MIVTNKLCVFLPEIRADGMGGVNVMRTQFSPAVVNVFATLSGYFVNCCLSEALSLKTDFIF